MAYIDQEVSIQDGVPYFLYEFITPNETYRFCDYPEDVEWNSQTWMKYPIKHSEVKQSNELSKNSVKVTIPITEDTFSNLFVGWAPDFVITFTLRRGHFGSSDTLVYWKGRITSHNLKRETIEIQCESIFTSMRRAGVRARYQRLCRHAVYTAGCGLNKDDFAVSGKVTGLSELTLTINEASSEADNYFTGGALLFGDGSYRMITSHVGNQVTISRASRFLSENYDIAGWGESWGSNWGGVGVTLYPGCDRTIATCVNKFNNVLNNGGFKWIPSKNPMGGTSII